MNKIKQIVIGLVVCAALYVSAQDVIRIERKGKDGIVHVTEVQADTEQQKQLNRDKRVQWLRSMSGKVKSLSVEEKDELLEALLTEYLADK